MKSIPAGSLNVYKYGLSTVEWLSFSGYVLVRTGYICRVGGEERVPAMTQPSTIFGKHSYHSEVGERSD